MSCNEVQSGRDEFFAPLNFGYISSGVVVRGVGGEISVGEGRWEVGECYKDKAENLHRTGQILDRFKLVVGRYEIKFLSKAAVTNRRYRCVCCCKLTSTKAFKIRIKSYRLF